MYIWLFKLKILVNHKYLLPLKKCFIIYVEIKDRLEISYVPHTSIDILSICSILRGIHTRLITSSELLQQGFYEANSSFENVSDTIHFEQFFTWNDEYYEF